MYGFLLLGTLLFATPNWKRFFLSDKWGGYAKSTHFVDLLQNPVVSATIAFLWFVSAIALIAGWHTLIAAFTNLCFCRYFFVHMRWRGVLRGMGAPGFMTYWTGLALFLLEFASRFAPDVRPLALLTTQVDFALIMLSAGIYKATAGYARNQGMEYGLVNPQWGYWPTLWKTVPPESVVFKAMNHLAWLTEIVAAILMLVPQTRFAGGVLILLSFIFIASQIRLTLLAELVILDCFLFFYSGSLGNSLILRLTSAYHVAPPVTHTVPFLAQSLVFFLSLYLCLLPVAHLLLFYNFYAHKSFLPKFQSAFERYTNFFGLIIWRVFSVDVVNFFIQIYRIDRGSDQRQLLSNYGWKGGWRFSHVGESITITSLFTTLKYYSTQPDLFKERLLRYAKTLHTAESGVFLFEYISIHKEAFGFSYKPIAEYRVDTASGAVYISQIDDSVSVNAAHDCSPVREGVRPGSYVALGD